MSENDGMRATGITRKIDVLGRIVLPRKLLKMFNIDVNDESTTNLEMLTGSESIILTPYIKHCCFCHGKDKKSIEFKGRTICSNCLKNIRKI